jgi:Cu-processing system permease protein
VTALTIAAQEIRVGLRNRWVIAATLVMAVFALSLALLGSAPTGTVGAVPLAVVVVSLASLTIFLVPLIALMLSFDAIVGEHERGTLMLLLAYPVARWQVISGKMIGQTAILAVAILIGYGSAAGALLLKGDAGPDAWTAFSGLVATSVMLGASFVALGCLASAIVRDRATAAGLAVVIWLFFVLIYDTALLGFLVADQGQIIGKGALNALLLLNPADAYRLFNTTASGAASVYSGMAGPAEAVLPPTILVAALAAWIVLPTLAAVAALHRRSV